MGDLNVIDRFMAAYTPELVARVVDGRVRGHARFEYALKTLHPARAHDPEECDMLAHEAWLAHCMQSSRAADHLVRLHEGPPGGKGQTAFYLLYDWHAGETLQQMLERKHRFTPARPVLRSALWPCRPQGH